MKGDISVAGFMLTAEEWADLDPTSRAQLVAVITRRDDPWVAAGHTEAAEAEPATS